MCNSYPQFQNQIHGTGTPQKLKGLDHFDPDQKEKFKILEFDVAM